MTSSQIHHSDYWSEGGATDLDNLIMLCWFHHQEVHRAKIRITHHANGFSFDSSDGHIGITFHGSSANGGISRMAS